MVDSDITPHQTIGSTAAALSDAMPDPDYLLPVHPHLDHHHNRTTTSREAGSYISQRDRPSREATGGDESKLLLSRPTTTSASDGVPPVTVTVDNINNNNKGGSPTRPMHGKMLFSDLYKNPRSPLSKLRHTFEHPIPVLPPGLDEDLVSRDKVKQKEAVKRFLADRVRCDWEFNWPPAPPQPQKQSEHVDSASQGIAIRASSSSSSSDDHASSTNAVAAQQQVEPPSNLDTVLLDPAATAAVNAAAEGDALSVSAPPNPDPIPVTVSPTSATDLHPRDSGSEADSSSDSDASSIYSTISEDPAHFRPRADWTSDLSDSDSLPISHPCQPPKLVPILSPFRFDTPDSVGVTVRSNQQARRARRRREARAESAWNDGLACYNARRDAWTGARTVRVKPPQQVTSATSPPLSPLSPRRLSFWRTHSRGESGSSHTIGTPLTPVVSAPTPTSSTHHHHHHTNPLSPTTTHLSTHSTLSSSSDPAAAAALYQAPSSTTSVHPAPPAHSHPAHPHHHNPDQDYPIETLIPLPAPLIPAQNPMRASITPQIYSSLYDKVVVHSMQPSCPINLSDMVASCVAGWKRDGEWPPRSGYPAPASSAAAVVVGGARAGAGMGGGNGHGKVGGGGGGDGVGSSVLVVRRKKSAAGAGAGAGGGDEKQAGNGHGRRMSFGGLLGKRRSVEDGGEKEKEKEKEKERKSEEGAKDGKVEEKEAGAREEEGNESAGKRLRRGLQKVFSGLGGHHHANGELREAVAGEKEVV